MERKVVIASAKSNAAARTQFSGSTFADLKADPVFASIYGNGEGVEAIIKPGNVTLRDNDSVLPAGEFSVFLVPTKNKAGYVELGELVEEIESAIDAKGEQIMEEIQTAVRAILASHNVPGSSVVGDDELSSALREARNM